MAIAYFIPDQAKLLAAQNNNNHNNNNHSSSGSSNTNQQQPAASTSNNTAMPATVQSQNQHAPAQAEPAMAQHGNSNNFRANITIPLSGSSNNYESDIGCWELLTQIFCHALRFCNESGRQRTAIIHISLEMPNPAHATATAAPTVEQQQQVPPMQVPQATTTAPTTTMPATTTATATTRRIPTKAASAQRSSTAPRNSRLEPRTHKRRSRKH